MSKNPLESSGDNRGKSQQHDVLPEFARGSGLSPLGQEAAACLSSPQGNQAFAFRHAAASAMSSFDACGKGDWPPKLDLFESASTLPFFASREAATKIPMVVTADGAPKQMSVRTHVGENTGAAIRLVDHANLDAHGESARVHDGRQPHHGHRGHHGDRGHQIDFSHDSTAAIKKAVAAVSKPDLHHPYETVHRHHDGHYRVGRYGFSGQHLLKFLDNLGHPPSPEKIDELVRTGALASDFASMLKSPDYQAKLKELGTKLENGQKVEKSELQGVLPPQAQEAIASSLIDQFKAQKGGANDAHLDLTNGLQQKGKGTDSQFNVINTAVDKSLTPLQRGLLDALSGPESGGHYDMLFGGYRLNSYAWHPGKGPSGHTDAGRYQFVRSTWNEVAKTLGLHDFSPASQDKAAWYLAARDYRLNTGHDLNSDLERGRFNAKGLQNTWVSIKAHGSGTWMTHQFYPAVKRALSIQRDLATPSTGSDAGSAV